MTDLNLSFPMIGNGPRLIDSKGDGRFGSGRGSHPHRGCDILFAPGDPVPTWIAGELVRVGHPYSDDLSYKLVEILSVDRNFILRAFYVKPAVAAGSFVNAGDIIGTAQDITRRYDGADGGMGNHVHFEILVNPMLFVREDDDHQRVARGGSLDDPSERG